MPPHPSAPCLLLDQARKRLPTTALPPPCSMAGLPRGLPDGLGSNLLFYHVWIMPPCNCGHCALAPPNQTESASSLKLRHPAATPARPPEQPQPARPARVPYAAGCALVCIIAVVIGSIFTLGVSLVLPAVASPPALAAFHVPLALWLVLNIC